MLLKNLMEDKQLNFDQPLISIRRHSPTATSQKHQNHSHMITPHHLPSYRPELKSGPIRNPGTVPFIWEQSPGQPKNDTKPQTRNSHETPRLPPGRAKQQDSHDASQNFAGSSESKKQDLYASWDSCIGPSNGEKVENIEISGDIAEEKEGSVSGDSDEVYVDALDLLSGTQSSFLNCSMKPSGSFHRDSQACEFVTDTPHAPKKQTLKLQMQQPDETANRCKSSRRCGPLVCGLVPRFCLRSSLCLTSHVPAVSVRTQAPSSSSPSGSYSELENESRSDRSETKPTERIPKAELDKAKLRSETGQSERHTPTFLEQEEFLSVPKENRHVEIAGFALHSKGLKTFQELLDDPESDSEEEETKNEHTHSVDSPQEDLRKLHTVDEDEHLLPNAENLEMEKPQDFKLDWTCKDNIGSTAQEATEFSEKQLPRGVTWNNSGIPAPPPLPKSPSDSWLWCTLPSITTKHSPLRPFLVPAANPENYCSKAPIRDTKWENIVRNTNVQCRHMHYSEVSLFIAYMIIKRLKKVLAHLYCLAVVSGINDYTRNIRKRFVGKSVSSVGVDMIRTQQHTLVFTNVLEELIFLDGNRMVIV